MRNKREGRGTKRAMRTKFKGKDIKKEKVKKEKVKVGQKKGRWMGTVFNVKKQKRKEGRGRGRLESYRKKRKKKKESQEARVGEVGRLLANKRIAPERDVTFAQATTRDNVVFTPQTPADRRLLENVEGGLQIAKTNCEDEEWNGLHPLGGNGKVEGHSCVICGKFCKGHYRHILEHELKCLSKFDVTTIKTLAYKCYHRGGCREVRIRCRYALGHQCPLKDVPKNNEDKEKRMLKHLGNKIDSTDDLLNSW